MNTSFMRLFVAIPLVDELRGEIARYLGRLRREGVSGGLVRPENLHLSLQFLGDVAPETVPFLDNRLAEVARVTPAFSLSVGPIGTFGPARTPRVVWLATSQPPGLVSLAEQVAQVARECGISLDDRPFTAHITVARVRNARQGKAIVRAMAVVSPPGFSDLPVTRFELVRSTLTPDGAVYDIRHAYSLLIDE